MLIKKIILSTFKQVSERLNKNGIIISDNVLWSGKVLRLILQKNDEETNALVEFQ
jgi:predicted O-methyltransferase YrrM